LLLLVPNFPPLPFFFFPPSPFCCPPSPIVRVFHVAFFAYQTPPNAGVGYPLMLANPLFPQHQPISGLFSSERMLLFPGLVCPFLTPPCFVPIPPSFLATPCLTEATAPPTSGCRAFLFMAQLKLTSPPLLLSLPSRFSPALDLFKLVYTTPVFPTPPFCVGYVGTGN